MPPVHFKLKYGASTRRVTFQNQPTWAELAGRLHILYNLPQETVGVPYIDTDNDEITVSSNEELQDYYTSSYKFGDPVKLNVLDLSASKEVAPQTVNRNTFGADAFDFIEPDWHRVGQVGDGDIGFTQDFSLDGPHAFVEVVNSDVSNMDQDGDSDSEDERSTTRGAPFLDKGKRKASSISLGAASVTSVVAEESAEKFPIHVFDHNSGEHPSSTPVSQPEAEKDAPEVNFAHSTPKAHTKDVEMTEDTKKYPTLATEADDPPLPSINDQPTPNGGPNFATDLATLLTSFSGIIATHPELSEGVQNIIQNASSGAYWHAHRSALSEAVDEMSHFAAAEARNAEAEAARMVYDALGNLFRSFSVPGTEPAARPLGNQPEVPPSGPWADIPLPWQRGSGGFQWGRHQSPFHSWMHGHHPHRGGFHRPVFGQSGMHPPPPHRGGFHHPVFGQPGMHPPPPPPPGMYHPPPPPPPHPHPNADDDPAVPSMDHPAPGNDDTPTPSPPQPGAFPREEYHRYRHMHGGPYHHHHSLPPRPLPFPGAGPSSFMNPFFQSDPSAKPTPEELRVRVEKAKKDYRAHKQAYHQEREQRRRTRESPVAQPSTLQQFNPSAETTQVVSTGRGYQLELVSVPKRANTLPSHSGLRRVGRDNQEDLNTRAINRIAKKMADMGFTENSHPNLLAKIKASMPTTGTISKEREDDIVTTLLEDLIPSSPPRASAVASGSTRRAAGAWQ